MNKKNIISVILVLTLLIEMIGTSLYITVNECKNVKWLPIMIIVILGTIYLYFNTSSNKQKND